MSSHITAAAARLQVSREVPQAPQPAGAVATCSATSPLAAFVEARHVAVDEPNDEGYNGESQHCLHAGPGKLRHGWIDSRAVHRPSGRSAGRGCSPSAVMRPPPRGLGWGLGRRPWGLRRGQRRATTPAGHSHTAADNPAAWADWPGLVGLRLPVPGRGEAGRLEVDHRASRCRRRRLGRTADREVPRIQIEAGAPCLPARAILTPPRVLPWASPGPLRVAST